VESSLIEAGIDVLVIPVKSPHMAGLEVLVDWSNFTMIDFMIWKGVVLVIGAIIYGFWLGLTGR